MSDSDENITHVFDQTNGVVDGYDGAPDSASEDAVAAAAARRGDDAADDRAPRPDHDDASGADAVRSGDDAGSGRAATTEDEHTFAVDSGGTATDTDQDGSASTTTGGGARVAAAADSATAAGYSRAPEVAETGDRSAVTGQADGSEAVQRSEVAEPAVQRGDDGFQHHEHDGHDGHDGHDHGHEGHGDHEHGAVPVVGSDDRSSGATTGLGALAGDDSIAHVFDQTNGVVEGVEGESDGTAEGDEASAADRGGLNEPNPVGQQDAWHDDHYGADDVRDKNP